MKAAVYSKYGSIENMTIQEVSKPTPSNGEVLVNVKAASVNSWDWDLIRGKPYIYRLLFGIFRPRRKIIGSDFSGVIEQLGSETSEYKIGDEVLGDISGIGFGAFAEYVCVPEYLIAPKPSKMNFADAAAIPQAGLLALQGIASFEGIKTGDTVLINGAGGGVGTFAIQILKNLGLEITAVDRAEKLDRLKDLGADHTIDYQKEDFTKNGKQYNYILDAVAFHKYSEYKKSLTKNGLVIFIGGSVSLMIRVLISSMFTRKLANKTFKILAHKPNREDIKQLCELYSEGKVKPVLDLSYPLKETPQAIQRLGEQHVFGKVVITL